MAKDRALFEFVQTIIIREINIAKVRWKFQSGVLEPFPIVVKRRAASL